jgi:hypothetical protein
MNAQIHFMPYRRTGGMNSLEAVQLSCCCLVLFVGLLFYGEVRVRFRFALPCSSPSFIVASLHPAVRFVCSPAWCSVSLRSLLLLFWGGCS